jgi:hypothetical protein
VIQLGQREIVNNFLEGAGNARVYRFYNKYDIFDGVYYCSFGCVKNNILNHIWEAKMELPIHSKADKCKKCGNNVFNNYDTGTCDGCVYNPAMNPIDDEFPAWTSDREFIEKHELRRSGVEDNGECDLGYAYGVGCKLFRCTVCGHIEYWPTYSD